MPTFAMACDAYIKIQASAWKPGSRNAANWRSSLDHASAILAMPVDAISTADVVGIVTRLLRDGKAPTAKAVRQRVKMVMDYAIAQGYRHTNPANGEIDALFPRSSHKVQHHAAVPYAAVPEVMRKVDAIADPTWRGLAGAFKMMVLTAARTREVLGMRWNEIEGSTWTIPAARMKGNRDHRVPLSEAALRLLEEARKRTGGTGLVFRSPRGLRLDEASLRRVVKRIQIDATPHGFRSSFRDWCSETGVSRDVAEWSLAHSFMGDTEASYARSDLLEQRRDVMARWAAHCAA